MTPYTPNNDTNERYLTPKPSDSPGGTILVLDIPKVAGPGGKVVGLASRRIVINKTKGKMGAQVNIEEYRGGKKAKTGKTSKNVREHGLSITRGH